MDSLRPVRCRGRAGPGPDQSLPLRPLRSARSAYRDGMRVHFSLNLSLDGCYDHRAIPADEEPARPHGAEHEPRGRAALRAGDLRADGGRLPAAAGRARIGGPLRPGDRPRTQVRRLEHPRPGGVEHRA
ncbi:hypothetical protein [Nocardioides convexus]|uniref:hypothetical protein n=1 Tax=Nocardioides convexus TaxID=2712224 RepID=UPI0024189B9C|nr:hypothetical protein [Nocardioides convexus]